MLNLLVAIDTSLSASIALRTACSLESQISIQPIYVYDAPGRDMEVGAGWARHSWEKQITQLAQGNIEPLVSAERTQCPQINDPVVLKGDPLIKIIDYFIKNSSDLMVMGAPFRAMPSVELIRHFRAAARKGKKDLPLLLVKNLKNIHQIVVLTDGSSAAEKALGLLLKFISFLSAEIVLIGMPRSGDPSKKIQRLNLERGYAILKEKDVEAQGYILAETGYDGIRKKLEISDLLVCPVSIDADHDFLSKIKIDKLASGLFYIGPE